MNKALSLLIGTWITADEYGSDVEYTVSQEGEEIKVKAIDPNDGEWRNWGQRNWGQAWINAILSRQKAAGSVPEMHGNGDRFI